MNNVIKIAEGNYGFYERINITSTLLQVGDTLTIVIINNNERIIEKKYVIEELQNSTYSLDLILTKEDSSKLPVGNYIWGIEQSRTGALQDLLIGSSYFGRFIVERGV